MNNEKKEKTNKSKKSEIKNSRAYTLGKVLIMSVAVVVVIALIISGLKTLFPGQSTLGQVAYTSVLDGPVTTPYADSVQNNFLGMHLDREDPSPTPAPEVDLDSVNFEDYGQKIVVGSNAYDSFTFTTAEIESIATAINASANAISSEVNFFSMVVPTSCGVMLPSDYISSNYNKFTNQETACETINSLISSNIAALDIFSTLKANSDQKLYYSTENDWTSLCAYYAYTVWAQRRGDDYYSLTDYEQNSVDGYVGYLYTFIGSSKIDSPETIVYYEPTSILSVENGNLFADVSESSASKKTNVFLGGSTDQVVITNDSLSDGSVGIIVGDSSAYSLVPYLAEYYQTTYFIDFTLYEGSLNSLVAITGAVDVTYCVSLETASSTSDIASLQYLG
ncbi:MAG: DHHW family protein [Clostridia bacterium]